MRDRTLDLGLVAVDRTLEAAEAQVAEWHGDGHVREVTQNLRALRSWYPMTRVPRLRRALLREAMGLVGELARLGVGPGARAA